MRKRIAAVALAAALAARPRDYYVNIHTTELPAGAIRGQPGAYYVNVHNLQFPGGAIRGQLHAA
jgi:hypothetical protein